MQFEGTIDIKAPKEKIYEFLLDPNSMAKCLPGLKSIDVVDENRFNAVVNAGVSFMKGEFKMQFNVTEKKPPTHARLIVHGRGMQSTADIDALMDLADTPGGTSMSWKADAKIGGTIMGIGSRLVGSASENIIRHLFDCIKDQLEK